MRPTQIGATKLESAEFIPRVRERNLTETRIPEVGAGKDHAPESRSIKVGVAESRAVKVESSEFKLREVHSVEVREPQPIRELSTCLASFPRESETGQNVAKRHYKVGSNVYAPL